MNLSSNFTLEELTASEIASRKGLDNTPSEEVKQNLVRLAQFLEGVRKLLGKPVVINSGYRSTEVNSAIGGVKTSQHCVGCAADIRVVGMTPDEVVKTIMKSDLEFDQLIKEFDSWTHISIPNLATMKPRKNVLIIDKSGTRIYK